MVLWHFLNGPFFCVMIPQNLLLLQRLMFLCLQLPHPPTQSSLHLALLPIPATFQLRPKATALFAWVPLGVIKSSPGLPLKLPQSPQVLPARDLVTLTKRRLFQSYRTDRPKSVSMRTEQPLLNNFSLLLFKCPGKDQRLLST